MCDGVLIRTSKCGRSVRQDGHFGRSQFNPSFDTKNKALQKWTLGKLQADLRLNKKIRQNKNVSEWCDRKIAKGNRCCHLGTVTLSHLENVELKYVAILQQGCQI